MTTQAMKQELYNETALIIRRQRLPEAQTARLIVELGDMFKFYDPAFDYTQFHNIAWGKGTHLQ